MKKRLIKFEKDACQPCEMVSRFLDENYVDYERINAFNDPDQARVYKVRTVPTVILMEGNTELTRASGFNPKDLEQIINKLK
ncbi:MAG: thioredoxin family protein [Olivibacter sp.]|nr:thioredoxin family protein [Olivibacter sp. UJ_SKK_5.1]